MGARGTGSTETPASAAQGSGEEEEGRVALAAPDTSFIWPIQARCCASSLATCSESLTYVPGAARSAARPLLRAARGARGSKAPHLGCVQTQETRQTLRAPTAVHSHLKAKLISSSRVLSLQCRYRHCSATAPAASGAHPPGAPAARSPSLPAAGAAGLTQRAHGSARGPERLSRALLIALPFLEGKNSN